MPDNLEFPKVDRTTSTASIGWRLGSLTSDSQRTLEQFKDKLEEAGLYKRDASRGRPSHDDATLVRFLRARKFEIQGALQQFKETEHWRQSKQLDKLYDEFPVNEFCDSQEVYTQWTGRRAKSGQPLYVYKIGALTKERVNRYSSDSSRLEPRMMCLLEALLASTLPLCNACARPKMETPVDSTVSIIDVTGVSMARFWQLRAHMQRASVMATAHYPETLGNLYIVGAPGFFSVIWGWIKNWFDAHTVSKLTIVPANQVLSTLSSVIDIENIPIAYGGQLDWKFGDEPSLDREMRDKLGYEKLPRGPFRFDEEGGVKLVGSGRTDEEVEVYSRERRQMESATAGSEAEKEVAQPQVQQAETNTTTEDARQEREQQEQAPSAQNVPNELPAIVVDSPSPETTSPLQSPTAAAAASRHPPGPIEESSSGTSTPPPNGVLNTSEQNGSHKHTIEDAKRENVAAPVKALADELQNTL
ncbi:hypothetical protein ACM66B_005419 [Microbotryomycetes sp. NB124-2]